MSTARKTFLFIALPLIVIALGVFWIAGNHTKTESEVSNSTASQQAVAICDQILSPADLTKVTSVLYPGQVRGGDFKPHGGFRFDDAPTNQITVTAPLAAKITQGSRYIEQGELQYMFDFDTGCGLTYRLDHLRVLSAKLQAAADSLPAAKVDDSRTSRISGVSVAAGEIVATEVGLVVGHEAGKPNVFFDLGVYDNRQANEASKDAVWAKKYADKKRLAYYAVCWLDLLPSDDAATLRALPPSNADTGNTSDYCK